MADLGVGAFPVAKIGIEGVEQDFPCQPGETILRAGLKAGLGLPYDCSIGTCGECKIRVLSGTIQPNDSRPAALTDRDIAAGRVLACQAVPDGDCTIRVRLEDRFIAKYPPDYHPVRLVAVEAIAPQMHRCLFEGPTPAEFRPGQYARLRIPGTDSWRAFSMSNLPNAEGQWELMIRRVEGGRASDYLFLSDRIGETFTLDAPYGNAYYRAGVGSTVCIAGGAGLAPMVSVARAAAADPDCRSVTLYYGGRSPDDLCAGPYIAPLRRPDLEVVQHDVVSGDCPDWAGQRGFVHDHVARSLPSADANFYVAGPPAMVEATLATLNATLGVPSDRIFYDRFFF